MRIYKLTCTGGIRIRIRVLQCIELSTSYFIKVRAGTIVIPLREWGRRGRFGLKITGQLLRHERWRWNGGKERNDEAATTAPAHWHWCRRQWANWGDVGIGCSPCTTLTSPFVRSLSFGSPLSLSSFSLAPFVDSHSALILIFSYACDAQPCKFNSLTQLLLSF